jgi:isopenicillin-N N-acyltransferase-like protein
MKRLLACLAFVSFTLPSLAHGKEAFRFPAARKGDRAELKYVNGLPVLVVSGTPEEMGRAAGALAVKPGRRALKYPHELLAAHDAEGLWSVIVQGGNGMYKHFPADYKAELEALVKAAGVSRDPVVVGNTFFDLKKVFACSAVGLEKDRSATGGTLLARNLDYPSLGYIQHYSLVTVYRPRGKRAFASVGFPGLLGCLSGINDAGLSLGVLEVFDVKEGEASFNAKGLPYALCNRRLLEECATVEEARKLLERLPRTSTMSLAVADRDTVAVFEITPKKVVVRPARKGACCCTNHFHTAPLKPAHPVNVCRSFERFADLVRLCDRPGKVGPRDLLRELHAVNLGDETLQSMVFEPAALRLHLSVGPLPASRGPLHTLDLKPLFAGKEGR